MKKKKFIKILSILGLGLIGIILVVLPKIEFKNNGKLIKFSYSDDTSEFENNCCYSESYCYDKNRDISIYDFEVKNIFFFYIITIEYKEGNICDTEYVLEEEYIVDFLENAIIKHNEKGLDLSKLIEGKKAIVSNKRYFGNDYETSIGYILNGKHEILFIFYVDDMIVIQVGLSDEGPKFIAYQ